MLEEIKKLISEQLCVDIGTINEESELVLDLGADSLDIVQMLITMEGKFLITFEDEQMMNIKTVKDVYNFIVEHQK